MGLHWIGRSGAGANSCPMDFNRSVAPQPSSTGEIMHRPPPPPRRAPLATLHCPREHQLDARESPLFVCVLGHGWCFASVRGEGGTTPEFIFC